MGKVYRARFFMKVAAVRGSNIVCVVLDFLRLYTFTLSPYIFIYNKVAKVCKIGAAPAGPSRNWQPYDLIIYLFFGDGVFKKSISWVRFVSQIGCRGIARVAFQLGR